MSYFPVIVKTEHLATIRDVMMKRYLQSAHTSSAVVTFDDAIASFFKRDYFSEFNIICTILWNRFRDDYYWVINDAKPLWRLVAPGQVSSAREAGIDAEMMTRTRPHVAIHWSYQQLTSDKRKWQLRDVIRYGVCYSTAPSQEQPEYCRNNASAFSQRSSRVNPFEFSFEDDDFSKISPELALQSHLRRISHMDACPHAWRQESLNSLL